jgi:fimbrial chaperone protein
MKNPGNIHFEVLKLRVRGLGPNGSAEFERELPAAYVLAGGTRLYDVEVPSADCAKLEHLEIEVTTDQDTFVERFDPPAGLSPR